MNKNEINEEFDILIKTVNKVLNDNYYKNSFDLLNSFKDFLINWKKQYINSNTLTMIDIEKLSYYQIELSEFFGEYEEYDQEINCYTEILRFHYTILLRLWKNNLYES